MYRRSNGPGTIEYSVQNGPPSLLAYPTYFSVCLCRYITNDTLPVVAWPTPFVGKL